MAKLLKNKKFLIISICTAAVIGVTIFFASGGIIHIYDFLYSPLRDTVEEFEYSADLFEVFTKEEAIEDIDYILKYLEGRHPAFIKGLSEEAAEQARIEKENLPEFVTTLQLWRASARILAVLGDAHTVVWAEYEEIYHIPITFRFSDGKLYARDGEFEGYAVNSIGGISVEKLYETFKSQFSYEIEGWAADYFRWWCRWGDGLAFMGVDISEDIAVAFETRNGEVTRVFEIELYIEPDEDEEIPFVWYEIDAENGVGILTLTECKHNDVYKDTLREFFTEVKENGVQTVVVDLRLNGGGKITVADEFISYLDIDVYYWNSGYDGRYGPFTVSYNDGREKNERERDLLFHGDVYALTSSGTFSAAIIFANMLVDNGLGKIVGEIPGDMSSFYGGNLMFQTPNARLAFVVSNMYYRRPDESKAHLPLIPDYEVSASDALDKVYSLIN